MLALRTLSGWVNTYAKKQLMAEVFVGLAGRMGNGVGVRVVVAARECAERSSRFDAHEEGYLHRAEHDAQGWPKETTPAVY
jgi:hypothetical protein